MSDTYEDQQAEEGGIAQLREAARRGKAALDENTELRRQLMFSHAGVDVSTKIGKMLFQTWSGDDLESLKTEAKELGLFGAQTSAATNAPDPTRVAEDQERLAIYESLAGGKPPAASPDFGEHPIEKALVGYQDAVRSGSEEDDARTDAMAQIFAAAGRGDRRVFFDAGAHAAAAEDADRLSGRRN